jgi:hypothetical protein
MLRIQYGYTCVCVNLMGCRRHPSCRRYRAPDRHSAYPAMCGVQCTVHGVLVHTACTPTIEGSHGRHAGCIGRGTQVCTETECDGVCTQCTLCARCHVDVHAKIDGPNVHFD